MHFIEEISLFNEIITKRHINLLEFFWRKLIIWCHRADFRWGQAAFSCGNRTARLSTVSFNGDQCGQRWNITSGTCFVGAQMLVSCTFSLWRKSNFNSIERYAPKSYFFPLYSLYFFYCVPTVYFFTWMHDPVVIIFTLGRSADATLGRSFVHHLNLASLILFLSLLPSQSNLQLYWRCNLDFLFFEIMKIDCTYKICKDICSTWI